MMKGISALAAALLGLIPHRLTSVKLVPNIERHSRGKGKGGVPALLVLHRSIGRGRPERPRHWHNPADPIQAARIEAAREKRERKQLAQASRIFISWHRNPAHSYEVSRLDPLHVVRS